MAEEELESLFVRLTGDGTSYQNMLKEAVEHTKEFGETVVEVMATIAEAVGGHEILSAYASLETATVRLSAALKSAGQDAKKAMGEYNEFAESMERTSLTSRAATINLLAQANQLGYFGEEAQRVVRQASGLASLGRGSAGEAISAIAAFEKRGNFRPFSAFDPLLRRGGMGGGGMGMMGGMGGGGKHAEEMRKFAAKEIKRITALGLTTEQELLLSSFNGQMKILHNNLESLQEDLGKIMAKYAKPFVKMITDSVKWLKELNPQIKEWAVGIGALITAVTAAGPLFRLSRLLLSLAVSMTPLTIGFALLATLVGVWVHSMGGVEKAWDRIKEIGSQAWQVIKVQAQAFIDFIWPAILATWSLFKSVFQAIQNIASTVFNFVIKNWQVMFQGMALASKVDWEFIRDVAIQSIIAIEFEVTHFQEVWSLMTDYAAMKLANMIGLFIYWGKVIGATVKWFVAVWTNAFMLLHDLTEAFVRFAISVMKDVFTNFKDFVTGKIGITEIMDKYKLRFLKDLRDAFRRGGQGIDLVLPPRVETALEKFLREEYERNKKALDKTFEQFKAERMQEFFGAQPPKLFDNLLDQSKELDGKLGAPFREATKDIEKFEAVAYGSAEALSHVQEYYNKLEEGSKGAAEGAGIGGEGGAGGPGGGKIPEASLPPGGGDQTGLLTQIRDAILADGIRWNAPRPVTVANLRARGLG